jgi:hypothetical protein
MLDSIGGFERAYGTLILASATGSALRHRSDAIMVETTQQVAPCGQPGIDLPEQVKAIFDNEEPGLRDRGQAKIGLVTGKSGARARLPPMVRRPLSTTA